VAVLSSCRAARPSAALALHAALPIFVPTLTAGPAKPTGARPIYGNDLPRSEAGNAWANGLHFTGSLGTDDQRKLALGEGHAPPAPHIDVVQRHRPYAERHLAERR